MKDTKLLTGKMGNIIAYILPQKLSGKYTSDHQNDWRSINIGIGAGL